MAYSAAQKHDETRRVVYTVGSMYLSTYDIRAVGTLWARECGGRYHL